MPPRALLTAQPDAKQTRFVLQRADEPPTNVLAPPPPPPAPPQRSRFRPDSARVGDGQHEAALIATALTSRMRSDTVANSGLPLLPPGPSGENFVPGTSSNVTAADLTTSGSQSHEMQRPKPFYKRQTSAELQRRPHVRRRGRASSSASTSDPASTPSSSPVHLLHSTPAASSSHHGFPPSTATSRSGSPSSSPSRSAKPRLQIITQDLPTQPKNKLQVEWPTKRRNHPFYVPFDAAGGVIEPPRKDSSLSSTPDPKVGVAPVNPPSVQSISRPSKANVLANAQTIMGPGSETLQKSDVMGVTRPMPTIPNSYPVPDFSLESQKDKGKGKAVVNNPRACRPLPVPPLTQLSTPVPAPAPTANNNLSLSVHALLNQSIIEQHTQHNPPPSSNDVPPSLPNNLRRNPFDSDSTPSLTRSASLDSISAWSQASGPATGMPPSRMNTLMFSVRGPRPLVRGKSRMNTVVYQVGQEEQSNFDALNDWVRYDQVLTHSNRPSSIVSFDDPESAPEAEGGEVEPAPSLSNPDIPDDQPVRKPRNKLRRADTKAVREMILRRRDRAGLESSGRSQDRFAGKGFGTQVSKKFGLLHLRKASDESSKSDDSIRTANGKGIELGKMIAVM